MAAHLTLLTLLTSVALLLWRVVRDRRRSGFPLPPGPKRWPILGSLLDWPTGADQWDTFNQWRDQYGELLAFAGIEGMIVDECR
jgi:hypothetical protein